ncbi:Hypothetical protein A7982_05498 [Minicystis rosea]|nr:Hypothetical protein A7982_05498 [Minicystis rosea]
MNKLSRILLAGVAMGIGSLMGMVGCTAQTTTESSEETKNEGADENTATAEEAIYNCQGATPFVCHQKARAFCSNGQLCGVACACPCEWYCCDTPSNSCQ